MLGALGLLALCGQTVLAEQAQEPIAGTATAGGDQFAPVPQDWALHGGPNPEWYYSPLDQINAANVKQLAPAWHLDFDTSRGQEATPLVVDGVLYTTTAWSKVYAVDARTGRMLWVFDPKVPGPQAYKSCCDVVNRGPAVYKGKVYISTIDGRLIALDAKNGHSIWSELTVDPRRMYSITGAPRAFRDKVLIGNSGGDMGVRGYVSAYDAATGKLVWRFYTVPGDPSKGADGAASDEVLRSVARPTWSGNWYRYGGGGVVWNAITYDPEFNRVYLGTGNPFPWNTKFRTAGHGDNLFTSSIVALDADTGKYVWHYQETPGDSWDYDADEDMMLADLNLGGVVRRVLMQAPKNGFFYVLDRQSGKLISADPFVSGITWATGVDLATGRPEVVKGARYADAPFKASPGAPGAHSWPQTAFSPLTGLVYIPTFESAFRYVGSDQYRFVEGIDDLGIRKDIFPKRASEASAASAPPASSKPSEFLTAWDPVARKIAWSQPSPGRGGLLATAGNLIFQGRHRRGTAGELLSFRADNGEELWRYPTPNAILAGAITYRLDGEQYIAVVTGAGGSDIIEPTGLHALAPQPGRLVVFKLGGTDTLPADPRYAASPNPPKQQWPAPMIAEGGKIYARVCARCHGVRASSSNIVPDLRRSAVLANAKAWDAIVLGGALKDAGMIGWRKFLTRQQIESIRAFVGDQSRQLALSEAQPH
jgi:quinohemoprotein ethanol dehydrogenase